MSNVIDFQEYVDKKDPEYLDKKKALFFLSSKSIIEGWKELKPLQPNLDIVEFPVKPGTRRRNEMWAHFASRSDEQINDMVKIWNEMPLTKEYVDFDKENETKGE